jgi:tetratricopeptide (TPR) repeat protein
METSGIENRVVMKSHRFWMTRFRGMQEPAPAQQRAEVDGQGNVTVQIVGENNRVTIAGAAALRLTMFPRRRQEGGDIGLLSAYTQSIDLVGRESELENLRSWLASGRDIAIQVRTGKAGTGKTRLAFDLCDQLLKEEEWQAGFVNGDQLANLTRDVGALWGWDRPTLAVVDYAAERAEALNRWFGQLESFAPTDGPPLRILLLERQADATSGWLQTALEIGDSAVRAIQATEKPIELFGLEAPEHRRAILDAVFAKLGSTIRTPAAGADPDFDRRLAEVTFGGEPLFLMMAALLAIETSLPQVLDLPRTAIAQRVAEREIGRVRRLARGRALDPDLLVHMAAYITLCQGLDRKRLLAAIEAEAAQTKRGLPGGAAPVADALADALPGTPAAPEPIRPDALGEAVVLKALGDTRVDGRSVVQRAFGQIGAPVATFVIRTAQDFVGAGYEQPLEWLDGLGSSVDVDQLMMIADELPRTSLALANHAVRIHGAIAQSLTEEVGQGRTERVPSLAGAYNNLASSLSAVGRCEAALAPAQEAVTIRRKLAAEAPDADLAQALNNLANRLSEVGQREAALAPAQEAVAIYRKLAAKAPDLAGALNNLANRLSEVGQREAALAPAQEAVAICRELATKAPKAYRPNLAMALNNLANRLSEVGQREAALAPAQEAADLYRELAAKTPDAYRPGLALALNNLAKSLGEVGQREAALAPAKEAVAIRRELATKAPDAYRPDLAMALNNLAVFLSALGQREAALAPVKEAAEIYRELAAKAPEAYRSNLAGALNNLATSWSAVGQREAALAPAREAAEIYRELAAKAPGAYRPALATALNTLANRLSEVGKREAALAPAQEAVAIRRELAARAPDAYRPDLAMSLNNLAACLSAVGQREAALAPAREAAEIYRELAAKAPDAYRQGLALALNNLATFLSEVGQRAAALAPAKEAVQTLAPHFLALPQAFATWMLTMYRNYLDRCEETKTEPDGELLGPIFEVLQRIHAGSANDNQEGGGQ